MTFNAIRENKVLAKISGFTVHVPTTLANFNVVSASTARTRRVHTTRSSIVIREFVYKDSNLLSKNESAGLTTIHHLCTIHTITDHLAGSTTDQTPRMTPEMTITIVRYGCTAQVLLRMITDAIRKYTD